ELPSARSAGEDRLDQVRARSARRGHALARAARARPYGRGGRGGRRL
ncbi:MAG: hypothetical protein AVDCRST_MAG78-1100, partial [uncultured Rubrobacteraceae bacterium]